MSRFPYVLFQTRFVLLSILLLGISACFPGSQIMPAAGAIPLRYKAYQQKFENEYANLSRPPGDMKQVAEFFMQQYQPGPLPRVFEHSVIKDRHGQLLAELVDEGRRSWVGIDSISKNLIDAIVATEDASFFDNDGVDEKRLVGALLQNVQSANISAGGSTITMQMARNLFFAPEKRFDQSLDRKISEIFLAKALTKIFSKDEILELYLNLVYFGNGTYGAEAAAQGYFGKSAKDLSWNEATLLAGLPQSPSGLDPFTNLEGAKARQRTVLDLLVRRAYLTQASADRIAETPIVLQASPFTEIRAPHFVRFVTEYLAKDLQVIPGRAGLRVTTTLDLKMQDIAQKTVAEQVNALRGAYNLTNGALIALKPRHAEILVMVGSADFNNRAISGQVNVALSPRQPGSTMKAILYSTAFNDNLISPSTVVWDLPVRYTVAKVQTYIPANYDLKFHGPVTIRTAFSNSYNVPAIKVIDAVGPDRVAQIGRAMGLISLSDQPGTYNLPLTLGANEVNLLDLTNAFHTIANEGIYSPYRYILSVEDAAGQKLDLYPEEPWWQAISPEAAFLATSIMSDYKARQPAFGINSPLNLAIYPAAAKTGTSSSFRDNWTVGFTRNLVVGVWAGNSNGRPMSGASGVTGAAPIWNKFLTQTLSDAQIIEETLGVSADPAYWQFTPPPGIVQRALDCPKEVYCSQKTEYYRADWLERSGRNGPVGDGIAMNDRVANVRVSNGSSSDFAGVCSTPLGDRRTVLTLPMGFGQLAPKQIPVAQMIGSLQLAPYLPVPSLNQWQFVPLPESVDAKIAKDRQDALSWSRRVGTQLHLGPCNDVATVVRSLFGKNSTATVIYPDRTAEIKAIEKVQNAANAASNSPTPTPTVTPTPIQTAEATATATPIPVPIVKGEYYVANSYADNECPGNYLVGFVLNAQGAAIPGVVIRAIDQWGNVATGVSKSGAGDFGQWDIPLDFRKRSFSVVVLSENGAVASPTITIEHQGDAGPKCHHIIWKKAR